MSSYHHFTLEERESIAIGLKLGKSLRKIASELEREPSSISRELKRNQNKDKSYNAWRGTVLYIIRRRKSKRKYRFEDNSDLKEWVVSKLSMFWSPETITEVWKRDHNNSHLSHSTIYAAFKRRQLLPCETKTHLRRKGKMHQKQPSNCCTIHPDHLITERPQIIEKRERIGDWEGDTIYGKLGKNYLVTCADRNSRFLVAQVSENKYSTNINQAFLRALKNYPVKSITLDNGSEFCGFRVLEKDLDTTIYFAELHSPWQRGTIENINGILRFFFPRGTDFITMSQEHLDFVVNLINERPRKCLGWLSPAEVFFNKCCT